MVKSKDGRHNNAQCVLRIECAKTFSCPVRNSKNGSTDPQKYQEATDNQARFQCYPAKDPI